MAETYPIAYNASALSDVLLNGKFQEIITVSKTTANDGIRANYRTSDYTDDAACIQAAIDSLPVRGILYAFGNFVITSEISLGWYQRLDLRGAYFDNSTNPGYCFRITHSGAYARGVYINGGKISGGGGGICMYGAKDCHLSDIDISGAVVGLDIDGYNYGTWYNSYRNIMITGCSDKGVYVHTSGSSDSTTFTMFGGRINSCNYGVYVDTATGHNFHGVNIESNTTYNIYCNGLASFYGCRIEDTGKDSIYATPTGYIFIYEGRNTGAYRAGTLENIHILYVDGTDSHVKNGSATITAGETYVNVTHGLPATPTRVFVYPSSNPLGKYSWHSALGTSTFRINIDSAAASDITFDWIARV